MNYTKIMLDNLEHSVIVKKCLEKGVNVNIYNNFALRNASFYGRTEIVEMLLKAGADATACDNEALTYAYINGNTEIIKLLEQYTDKNLKGEK